jgi:hypothetical protein
VKLCAQARERQFVDHLAPVWLKLPDALKDTFYVADKALQEHAATRGVHAVIGRTPPGMTALVASFGDYNRTTGPVILMEHGIGHKYSDHGSYAGGAGKERVVLYLATNRVTKQHHLDTYPDTPVEIIGVPKMDTVKPRPATGRVVCISFHWDCKVSHESRSAFDYYRNFLHGYAKDDRYTLIGHAHPRPSWQPKLQEFMEKRGIPFLTSFEEVLDQADVYITDNSSTGYEFAAAGRHTIHLNAPWYRRHVETGIRFWDYLPGPMVDSPRELPRTIVDVLDNPDKWENQRKTVVRQLYPNFSRGTAAQKAADAIVKHLGVPVASRHKNKSHPPSQFQVYP